MVSEQEKTSHDPDWAIKSSIAKAIAQSPKPSLARLHQEILEEFGYRPDLEIVDYFCSITEVQEQEVADYFRKIALPTGNRFAEQQQENGEQLAERIASGPEPTMLKFRTEYGKAFGNDPPEELLRYFLKKIQETGRRKTTASQGQGAEFDFAAALAARPEATVLKFRHAFTRKFGRGPTEELTGFFLQEMKKRSSVVPPAAAEDDSKVNFAKTVAGGLVTTILQFRKTFEKAYGVPPSAELIDVFLKHLPIREK